MKIRKNDENLTLYKNRKTKDILTITALTCVLLLVDGEFENIQQAVIFAGVSFTFVLGFLWVFRKLATMAERDDPWY